MDEVDIDEFLKEAAMAIDDAEKLSEFIREKATIAIERFLVSLKKDARIRASQVSSSNAPNISCSLRITYRKCPFQLKNVTSAMDGC